MSKQPKRPKRTRTEMARGFLTDSEAFLIAAQVIDQSGKVAASGPKYYLASHAVELILKSFILNNGGSESELKKIRHDLCEAWRRASELGLKADDVRTETLIKMLAPYHLDHRFRYRQTGFLTLPAVGQMCDVIRNLIHQIGPDVDRAMRAEIRAKRKP